MPYITKQQRDELNTGRILKDPGELNYRLTQVIKDYTYDKGLSYKVINDIIGALESCKLEYYRRVALPYENSKISENGDVYS